MNLKITQGCCYSLLLTGCFFAQAASLEANWLSPSPLHSSHSKDWMGGSPGGLQDNLPANPGGRSQSGSLSFESSLPGPLSQSPGNRFSDVTLTLSNHLHGSKSFGSETSLLSRPNFASRPSLPALPNLGFLRQWLNGSGPGGFGFLQCVHFPLPKPPGGGGFPKPPWGGGGHHPWPYPPGGHHPPPWHCPPPCVNPPPPPHDCPEPGSIVLVGMSVLCASVVAAGRRMRRGV